MSGLKHFLKIGIENLRLQSIALRKLSRELMIGFGDSHNPQVCPLLKLIEKSGSVAMDKPGKRDTQRRFSLVCRGLRLSAQFSRAAAPQDKQSRQDSRKQNSSHNFPSSLAFLAMNCNSG
jgi:hypothetical protein